MSAQMAINGHLMDWDETLRQYAQEVVAAATAEAEHKRERAKFIVDARARNVKLSAAQAETEAEADGRISGLYLNRLGTAALAEGTKSRLVMMRAKADALRSQHVDERASAQLYADRGPGA